MISIPPSESLREYLNRFIYELADETTLQNIKQGLQEFYSDENLNIDIGYDYYGYLNVRLAFDTEEDAVIFKLKNCV